ARLSHHGFLVLSSFRPPHAERPPGYTAPVLLAFARCDHRPNARGETECPEYGSNDGEGLRRGAPGLGRQGRILRLLGGLLGPPYGTLHFPRGGQALRKLEVCRRVDIVELSPARPRLEGFIDRRLPQAPEKPEAIVTGDRGDEVRRVVARLTVDGPQT